MAPELDPIEGTFKALSPLFPDCEPEHMRQLISQAKGNVSERSQQVSAVLIEKSYPKCAKPATPEIKRSRSAKISPDAVLKKDWYKEDGSTPGANYLQLVLPTLLNRHPRIPKGRM